MTVFQVLISQDVDLEKPEFESQEFTVNIYADLFYVDSTWTSNYTLPVHLRYHAISEGIDYATMTFNQPEVAIRCQIKEYGMQYFGMYSFSNSPNFYNR